MKFTDTFIKKAIASGAIVPPPNERPNPHGYRLLALAGWFMALLGAVALAVAYFVGRS